MKSNVLGLVNILERNKNYKLKIKLFNAGSGQFYGNNKNNMDNLNSKLAPQSPYGVAKAASYWLTKYIEKIIKFIVVQAYYLIMNHL